MTDPTGRLCVVGAGSMGAQIAQQAALHGIEVALQDTAPEQLSRAVDSNRARLERRVERGRIPGDVAEAALARVRTTTSLEEAAEGASLAVEAIVEQLEPKRLVFAELGRLLPEAAILASNSSTMTPSQLAGASGRPDRVLGLHFFYPPLVMELVEVVRGPQTSDRTVERATAFVEAIGRTPVVLQKEIGGFIVNRILHMASQEAYRLLDQDVASFEDIDTAVEKGLRWPLGPFRLGDLSGLDVTYAARRHMFEQTGDERYRPSEKLRAKVEKGQLGRKTGQGWYTYEQRPR
ncbi:MAG: 3-hydroxyacyl-CoA dehydrogenase family protein [Candidatus Dormibacteraceae bacterium]